MQEDPLLDRQQGQEPDGATTKRRRGTILVVAVCVVAVMLLAAMTTGPTGTKEHILGSKRVVVSQVAEHNWRAAEQGESESFEIKFLRDNEEKSVWHFLDLVPRGLSPQSSPFHSMVVEIPRYSTAKLEVTTTSKNNPIQQDRNKDGSLRHYHGPIYWNYGLMPQTWENPKERNEMMSVFGDNDPLDVVEIGTTSFPSGAVVQVKVLGCLAMIDSGELDWKIIAIAESDPHSTLFNDINDVPDHVVAGIREWFRWYKTPSNKPLNKFGFEGKALDRQQALEVVAQTHHAWHDLVAGRVQDHGLWVPSSVFPPSHAVDVGAPLE